MTTPSIELLAPARDPDAGIAALHCGADAVYIGAPRFGARARVGNTLPGIEKLLHEAHKYWAKIYVTVNTLLTDRELPEAVILIRQLYEMGVDGVIIQDAGLLECDLPPIPLIASTQMHNHTPDRVAFLEKIGIRRVILARELSLEEIRAIRAATTIELEFFVHGALCVSYSGQCYMSYAIGGRSGNRGECAQPCRRKYSLIDADGKTIINDRYLLSLRDLNLSNHLGALLDAGITSFKIEGRLKDENYVKNVVSAYRRLLDTELQQRQWRRSSSGMSEIDFVPDLDKNFNRGYTSYFLSGRSKELASLDTPKMIGQLLGKVTAMDDNSFTLETQAVLTAGDGLAFFDSNNELAGTFVNRVAGPWIFPEKMQGIAPGTILYRNRDQAFQKQVSSSRPRRYIPVTIQCAATATGLAVTMTDADGTMAAAELVAEKVRSEKPQAMLATLVKQLGKLGDSEFKAQVHIDGAEQYFYTVAQLNALRREAVEKLRAERLRNRPAIKGNVFKNNEPYPQTRLSFNGNVLNEQAAAFYRRHGVTEIEPAAESGLDMRNRKVMTTRYCLAYQLGVCPKQNPSAGYKEPLWLVDEQGRRFRLAFNCRDCVMEIFG
ncbi:MAG TPA: U32 family peptidase [bacterium]|nr:U32 family peptidase [bacterium]HPN44996.1 U32 family peptidase [bacterium]